MDRPRSYTVITLFFSLFLLLNNQLNEGLKLVDFLAFCGRAQNLSSQWINQLYPPYYAALLKFIHPFTADALVSGRIISGFSALLMLSLWSRKASGMGIGLFCSGAMLVYSSTEGTDMPSAALSLSALCLARSRPATAGTLCGLAFGCRYTALAAIPSLIWLSSKKRSTVVALLFSSFPCWLPTILSFQLPIDMTSNIRSESLFSAIGVNATHASWLLACAPMTYLGFAGLYHHRNERQSLAIALYALVHLLGCSLYFTNPRLLLPVFLCLGLLAGNLQKKRWFYPAMIPIALFAIWQSLQSPKQSPPDPITQTLSSETGCFVSNSPWAHKLRSDGWLEPGISINELTGKPSWETLTNWSKTQGCSLVVINTAYPMPKGIPIEQEMVKAIDQWRIYRL